MRYNNRIIFFSRDLNVGGMEKALVSLLNKLADKNYGITLVLENKVGALINDLDKRIVIKRYRLSSCKITFIRKAINFTHRLWWCCFNRNRYGFSCNYATYSVIGSKLACIASKNSALYVHSNYLGYYKGDKAKSETFFNSIDLAKFNRVLFVSKESKDCAKDIFPQISDRFTVLSNIVNAEEIIEKAQQEAEEKFSNEEINLLFVGRLDDTSKNFELLLNSFKLAYGQKPRLRLYIIGNGPDKQKIEKCISDNAIEGVTLLGEKINPYPYMRQCDSLILTSRYEGYPIVYVEALILNKQFITTVPVRDDFIDITDYFTVVEDEPEDVSQAILKINKHNVDYGIDFSFINHKRICIMENIISGRNIANEN